MAVNSNKVLFFHSTHSTHVSARTGRLQVNTFIPMKLVLAIDGHYNRVLA
jgi:hypothetical protein